MNNTNKPKETAKLKISGMVRKLEKLVLSKQYVEAVSTLSSLLAEVELAKEGFGNTINAVTPEAEAEATIVASLVTEWLCDDEYKLTKTALRVFASQKRALMQIFEISGYRGTTHFIRRLGEEKPDGGFNINKLNSLKLFCGLSINALSPSLVKLLTKQDPEYGWLLVVGFLSEQILWSKQAEDSRSRLIAAHNTWRNLKRINISGYGPAYMGCSYADDPNKHVIKKTMNEHVSKVLNANKINLHLPPTNKPRIKSGQKPRVLIIAELYDSIHAMHRCYGPAMRGLKTDFELVYMSTHGVCDPKLNDMFDIIDNTPFSIRTPKVFIDKARSYKPDIVYFPSIGMRTMSIVASNVRMAPIQLMTFGHPATSMSAMIDYAILVDGQLGDEKTVNETILYRPTAARWQRRKDADDIEPNIRRNPDTIRIAVPAWSRKVTPRFLRTCQVIAQKASKPVEFVFFPNGLGPIYQAFTRRVTSMMPAKVHHRTGYNDYIRWINECDIFLSTFPFGATNGIIDAALQGLPVVNLVGGEVHAKNDSDIVAKFEQPDWLTTHSVNEYIQAVLRLIENDEERVAISEAIANFDHSTGLFVPEEDACDEFGIIMKAVYHNHEAMKKDGRKSWAYDDLHKMADAVMETA